MSREFRHPRGTVVIVAGEAQVLALDLICERLIQAVIAGERFCDFVLPIDLMHLSSGDDSDRLFLSGK